MGATSTYLLDTGVVIVLARAGELAEEIDRQTGIRQAPMRPLVSIVTHGEAVAFARRNQWGQSKQEKLRQLIHRLVTVDISDPRIIDAFAEVKVFAEGNGRSIGDNDLWIAATAKVTGAVLVTTDKDFDPLHGTQLQRMYFDPRRTRKP